MDPDPTPGRRPRIIARSPAPDVLAPAGTTQLSITFDRPMDPRRGGCRLSWGRIRMHTKNLRLPKHDFSVGSRQLRWMDEGHRLVLDLDAPICDGFRVRVEFSELRCAALGLSPVPEERELGASYVAVFAARPGAGDPQPPEITSLPPTGATDVRRDLTLELFPSQPLAPFDVTDFEVLAAGMPVPFHLRTNRNPPDWIFVHLEAPLPPECDVVVRAPGVVSTRGVPVGGDPVLVFRTGRADPVSAVVHPAWSEPTPGLDHHPTDRIEAALRFADRPVLDDIHRIRRRLSLVHLGTSEALPGLTADLDPTPGHYRTIFVRSTSAFPGMQPDAEYELRWSDLGWPGICPGPAGAVGFRTAPAGRPARPLAGCPHVCLIADDSGTRLQVAVQTHGDVASVWVVEADHEGWRADLSPQHSPRFRDMVDGDVRTAPPVLWTTLAQAPTLDPSPTPTTRSFEIGIRDGAGRDRCLPGLAFDMTQRAIEITEVLAGSRPQVRWRLGTPVDSQHLAIHDADGHVWYAGLFGPRTLAWTLPAGWDLPPGRYRLQLWGIRARPEDDLWDYAVADRPFEVEAPR